MSTGEREGVVFFQTSPPSYQKAAIHWLMTAKREETRRRRLAALIEDSAKSKYRSAPDAPKERELIRLAGP